MLLFWRSEMSGIWGASRFMHGPNMRLPAASGLYMDTLILRSLFNGDDDQESIGNCILSFHSRCSDDFLYSGTPEKMYVSK